MGHMRPIGLISFIFPLLLYSCHQAPTSTSPPASSPGFWDNYSLSDTTAANRDRIEQRFADFLYLLGSLDSVEADSAVADFVDNTFARPSLRQHYAHLIRHYLGNPNSPLRNDITYAHFLRRMLPCYTPAEQADSERTAALLHFISLNQPGSLATDFVFVDRSGCRSSLRSFCSSSSLSSGSVTAGAPRCVLLFYDPECEECQASLPYLLSAPALQRPDLTVLAIYPDPTTEVWQRHPIKMPANWTDAYSPEGAIRTQFLYYLPALPSLYLLDSSRRILLKDASPQVLLQVLSAP